MDKSRVSYQFEIYSGLSPLGNYSQWFFNEFIPKAFPRVKYYINDILLHDRAMLASCIAEGYKGFLFLLEKKNGCGTWLFDENYLEKYPYAMDEYMSGMNGHYNIYKFRLGGKLRKVASS